MKNSAHLLFVLVLLVVLTSVANGQLELRQDSMNSFRQVPLGDKTGVTAEINLTRQLFIEGYYHDFTDGKLGAILLVDMATDDGLVKLQYPAMVMLPGDGRNSPFQFPIYGPWFYQGDRDLKVTLTMVLLKKERAQELRNKFQSILGGVTNLLTVIPGVSSALPVINTGVGITNKAWDIFDLFASKDEKVPLGSFSITRVPLKDIKSETDKKELLDGKAIGTFQRWLVLTSSKSEPLYRNIQYTVTNQGAEPRPIVPANKDARVLLLRVKQTAPTASMKALGDRLAAFLGAQKTRLTNANVDLKNPFSGENLAAETHIQRIFNGLVAFTSEARNKAGMTNREAVLWMMGELLNGQNSGDSDASYVKLKTADEARVTAALNRMFKYQKSTDGPAIESNDGTQGFSKILVWYNWITKRDKADSISWDPASEVAPFGTVSGGYTLKRAASYLPATSTDTANPPNYNQMGEQINALRQGLLTIFRPTSGEPFMLFEQQATADWMRQSFSNLGMDVPGSFKSSDEVAEFAAKLDKVLSNKKVVIYDASQKTIEFQDIVPYARRLFGKQVAQIGPAATTDQTAKLREYVNVYIIPARQKMSADEQAELDKALGVSLVDNVSNTPIGAMGYGRFFEDNLFSIAIDGSIITTDADKNLTKAIRYWRGVYQSPDSIPVTARKALLSSAPLVDFMDAYLQQPNRPMSHYLRAITFIRESAPSLSDIPVPTTTDKMKDWDTAAGNKLSTFKYLPALGQFGDEPVVEVRIINTIDFNFSEAKRLGVSTPQGGVDDLRKLARFFADTSSNSNKIQSAAKKTLQAYVTLPPNQNGGTNPYLDFVEKWDPRWYEGTWQSGLLLDVENYRSRLKFAAEKHIEPQQGRLMLENLIGWFNNVSGLGDGARAAVADLLQEFVELPADIPLSVQGYNKFLHDKNPQWIDGKWKAAQVVAGVNSNP